MDLGGSGWICVDVDGSGWIWVDLDGSGLFWVDLGGSGWIWMDLGWSGWIWVDLGGSGWIWVDLNGSGWIWDDMSDVGSKSRYTSQLICTFFWKTIGLSRRQRLDPHQVPRLRTTLRYLRSPTSERARTPLQLKGSGLSLLASKFVWGYIYIYIYSYTFLYNPSLLSPSGGCYI